MTESRCNNMVITVHKDKVHFEGDYALVDVGMPKADFMLAMLEYVASDQDTMAVVKKGARY